MAERLSQRQYAEHRERLGLPGSSRGAVRAAIESGRIAEALDRKGRIDPKLADRLWRQRTQRRVDVTGNRNGDLDPAQAGFRTGAQIIADATLHDLPRLAAFLAVEAGAPAKAGYALARMLPLTIWSTWQDALDEVDGQCERDEVPMLWGDGELTLSVPPEPDWGLLAHQAGEREDREAWEAHLQSLQEDEDDGDE